MTPQRAALAAAGCLYGTGLLVAVAGGPHFIWQALTSAGTMLVGVWLGLTIGGGHE